MQREVAYDPVFHAQAHYRLLLDAMARPGKINTLPLTALSAPAVLGDASALVGFALLNSDVSFFVAGDGADQVSRYLLVNTSARPVEVEEADFVFAPGSAPAVLVERMKQGSLPYPEEGATLVLRVETLGSEGVGGMAITLQGPGVAGKRTFFVRGLNTALLTALQQANTEFPLGIDLILTDSGRQLACIPRSSRINWESL